MSLEARLSSLEDVVKRQDATLTSLAAENHHLAAENRARQAALDSQQRIIQHLVTTLVPDGFWIDKDGRGKEWEWSLEKFKPPAPQKRVGAQTPLLSLPPELLHLIVARAGRADLLALCLVNTHMLAIAAEILYREITADPDICDKLFLHRGPNHHGVRLDPFLSLKNIKLLILVDPIQKPVPRSKRTRFVDDTDSDDTDLFGGGLDYSYLAPSSGARTPTQTRTEHLAYVSSSRFDPTDSKGLTLPRLLLRTDISTLGALKQYAHLLRILNPRSFQIEGPLRPFTPAPAPAPAPVNNPFHPIPHLPLAAPAWTNGAGGGAGQLNAPPAHWQTIVHNLAAQYGVTQQRPKPDESLPRTPRVFQLDKQSRLNFLHTWHKLEEIIFIGQSVITDPSLSLCLARSSPLLRPGRLAYTLITTFASSPSLEIHSTFGPEELDERLKEVGKKIPKDMEGEEVVDCWLTAKWVAKETRETKKRRVTRRVDLGEGEWVEWSSEEEEEEVEA